MERRVRKVIAVLLCLAMLAGVMPVHTFADAGATAASGLKSSEERLMTVDSLSREDVKDLPEPVSESFETSVAEERTEDLTVSAMKEQLPEEPLPEEPLPEEPLPEEPSAEMLPKETLQAEALSGEGETTGPEKIKYKTNNNTVIIEGCDKDLEELVIPSSIEGMPVVQIANNAFKDYANLKNVVLPEGLESIGSSAFKNAKNLVTCTLPSTLVKIEDAAFSNCAFLSGEIDIPAATSKVGNNAFENCTSLTGVKTTFNDNKVWEGNNLVTFTAVLGDCAFLNCTSLSNVVLSGSIKSLGRSVFDGCTSLTELTLPEGLTFLGAYFLKNTAVEKLTVPATVTKSGTYGSNGAMAGSAVTELTFAAGTKEIPENICRSESQASALVKAVLPEGVEKIGNCAFKSAKNLMDCVLPTTLVTIGDSAFSNCESLPGMLDIPAATGKVGNNAYEKCISLTGLRTTYNESRVWEGNNLVTFTAAIGDCAFLNCTSLSDVVLAGSVKSLGRNVFEGCSSLRDLALPEGLTFLGAYFLKNAAVETLTIPSTVTKSGTYGSNGALAGSVVTELTFAPGTVDIPDNICRSESQASVLRKVNLPEGIRKIGNCAFKSAKSLVDCTLPSSLEMIGDLAFCDCESLPGELNIPAATAKIGNSAYENCKSLTGVKTNLNESMTGKGDKQEPFTAAIGDTAFKNAVSLANVTLAKSVSSIGRNAFEGCTSLKELTLPEGVTFLGAYFLLRTAVEQLTIPSTVTKSGTYGSNGALAGSAVIELTFAPGTVNVPEHICRSESQASVLQKVNLPEGVRKIGSCAFKSAKSLVDCTLPSSLEMIGDLAFCDCESLPGELNIPAATAKIGNSAYENCISLTGVKTNVNESTTGTGDKQVPFAAEIGDLAFKNAVLLTDVTIAKSVSSIGRNVFEGCSSLKELTLPEGVTFLGAYFLLRTSVEKLTIPSTVTKSGTYGSNGALAGSPVTEVTFAPGTKKIPAHICRSESQVSVLDTVVMPDSVTAIEDCAFQGCKEIKTLQLPASLTSLSQSALSGTNIDELRIATEDSTVALTLIDLEKTYVADSTELRDFDDRLLDRRETSYNAANSYYASSGMIPLTARYAFKKEVLDKVSNLRVTLKIPASASVGTNALKLNGEAVNYTEKNGKITFPVSETSGTISLQVTPQDTKYMMSYAKLSFSYLGEEREEILGIVNMAEDVLTLFVPAETSSSRIAASGMTNAGQSVDLYLEGNLVSTARASATGHYSFSVDLPSPENGAVYRVEARTAGENGKETSSVAFVKYRVDAVKLTRFDMYYRGKQYDLLSLADKSPVISWAGGASFTFEIAFDDPEKISAVRVVSEKNTGNRELEAVYDQKTNCFIATGFAGYVPGTIFVEYKEVGSNPYEGASTRIFSAEHEDSSAGEQLFYVDLGEEDGRFCYLTEYQENAAFDYTAHTYVQGVYKGKTCYTTVEPFEYERLDGCFHVQEIYVPEDNGTYTLLRTGIGLLNEDLQKMSGEKLSGANVDAIEKAWEAAKKMHEATEAWEKVDNIHGILTDKTKKSEEAAVYKALNDYIDDALVVVTDPKDRYDLQTIKIQLQYSELLDYSDQAIKKSKKTAKQAITAADDPAMLLPDVMEDKMDDCFDAMEKIAKDAKDKTLRDALKKLTKKKKTGKEDSLFDRVNDELNKKYKQSHKKFKGKYAVDPSGYAYEAVESNRLSGVTTTIYFKETEGAKAVLWDAQEYDQFNPLTTDIKGCYAWDVPEGLWQVKFEKDGYETAYSAWLPVPPPQLDVNIGMTATAAPTVKFFQAYENAVEIAFDQYVDVATVTKETVRLTRNGQALSGTWEALDKAASARDPQKALATTFRFVPETELSGELEYSLSKIANYAGKTISANAGKLSVVLNLKSVKAPESVEMSYGGKKTVYVSGSPREAAAGKTLLMSAEDSFVLKVPSAVTFDEDGIAKVLLEALLPGETTVRYNVEGTTFAGEFTVSVGLGKKTASEEPAAEEKVSDIVLAAETADVLLGKELQLWAKVLPETAMDRSLEWSSSDETVARVSADGVVSGIASGKAVITAAARDGSGVKASCEVTVKNPVTAVKLSKTAVSLLKGKKVTLKAAVSPETADLRTVTWKSSNTKVAKVSSKGVVQGVAKGTATITATAKDGSGVKAVCKVTVKQPVTKITLSKTAVAVLKGKTVTLKATAAPKTANLRTVVWKSGNTKVAKVSAKGVVTGIAKGTTTITAIAKDGSGVKAVCKVVVKQPVTKLGISKSKLTLKAGKTATLKVSVSPKTANNKNVTWKTSNKKIATISAKGVVKGLKKGTVTITAVAKDGSGKKVSCKVTVK